MDEKKKKKIKVEVEFTPGYEQRFTEAVLKIYAERRRAEEKMQVNSQAV